MAAKTRVIIVDDSQVMREMISQIVNGQPDMVVAGTAQDPFDAREKIKALSPDVVLLDIEMPRMDGLTFLKKLMKFHPVPTIICSSITPRGCALALECLEAGAFEVVSKPGGNFSVGDVAARLGELVRAAVHVPPPRASTNARSTESMQMEDAEPSTPRLSAVNALTPPLVKSINTNFRHGLSDKVIAIGTSTGGTEALREVLTALPVDVPPIVMVQHMPEGFTKAFADRLDRLCKIRVKEAQDGDPLIAGCALLAPGNRHMRLVRDGAASSNRWLVRVADGPRVLRHKPSVEVLFESCAQYAGARALGIIMTGMGNDGATGLLSMRRAGAITVGQDEQSCIVYGMPREAALCGAVQIVSPLDRIAKSITDFASGALTAHAA